MQNTNLISAEVVADSLNQYGERLTTLKLVFPRYILAELNTHRLFSKNSASSRAIPFRKMVKSVLENPFIPIAFQKEHTGMQGTDYIDANTPVRIDTFKIILMNVFKYKEEEAENAIVNTTLPENSDDFDLLFLLHRLYDDVEQLQLTLEEWWLFARDKAVESAIILSSLGVTKQLCNRILEPFLYHTVLLTASHFENFFELRCPKYSIMDLIDGDDTVFRSKKDFLRYLSYDPIKPSTDLDWLSINEGQADIHIMDLAEKMWDAMNDSKPKQLEIGQWHIPYGDNIDEVILFDTLRDLPILDGEIGNSIFDTDIENAKLKIATARCARISYQTLGDNPVIDYEKDIKLFDDLLTSGHWSPFEHCAQVMDGDDYFSHVKGLMKLDDMSIDDEYAYVSNRVTNPNVFGWSRNFKGFKQYRGLLDEENRIESTP